MSKLNWHGDAELRRIRDHAATDGVEQEPDRADYSAALRGLGHQQLKRPRGLRGSTFGPASKGRHLSNDERKAIEERLRSEGKL